MRRFAGRPRVPADRVRPSRYHLGKQAIRIRGGQRNRVSALEEILASVRADLAARQEHTPLERLKHMARQAPAPRDPVSVLSSQDVAVIAEVKRASPSRGAMAQISDP